MAVLRTLVVGVGNTLLSDEGVGVVISKKLMEEKLPAGVEIYDAGCALSDVLIRFDKVEQVIIIDAVQGCGKPGDVYCFDLNELKGHGNSTCCAASLHEIGVLESVEMAELAGWNAGSITIIGIEPEKLEVGDELSDTIKSKLPAIMSFVRNEIKRSVDTGE
jgi:hydrogenase maturation protease